jgi:hypothetical protein
MIDLTPLRDELAAVGATQNDYVLIGSIVMQLHGLPREVGDIDMFVTRPIYDALGARSGIWAELRPHPEHPPMLEADCAGVPVHVWYDFNDWGRVAPPGAIVPVAFATREVIEGWTCQSLGLLLNWKSRVNREKDAVDVAILRRYLALKVGRCQSCGEPVSVVGYDTHHDQALYTCACTVAGWA